MKGALDRSNSHYLRRIKGRILKFTKFSNELCDYFFSILEVEKIGGPRRTIIYRNIVAIYCHIQCAGMQRQKAHRGKTIVEVFGPFENAFECIDFLQYDKPIEIFQVSQLLMKPFGVRFKKSSNEGSGNHYLAPSQKLIASLLPSQIEDRRAASDRSRPAAKRSKPTAQTRTAGSGTPIRSNDREIEHPRRNESCKASRRHASNDCASSLPQHESAIPRARRAGERTLRKPNRPRNQI